MTDEYFMLEKIRHTILQIEEFITLANSLMGNCLILPLIDLEEIRVKLYWLKRAEKCLTKEHENG